MATTYIVDSSPDGLTSLQAGSLAFLVANAGRSITIRQMMNAFGLKSPAPVLSRLNHLKEKGKLRDVA